MSKYSLRERTDVNGRYHIVLDQDGFNQPITHWYADCKANRTKKVEALRAEGIRRKEKLMQADKPEHQYKEVKVQSAQERKL